MQYNKRIIISIVLAFSLMFVGCNSNNGVTSTENSGSINTAGQGVSSQLGAPDRMPDLTAKINTIRGNKLTVYKMIGGNQDLSEAERAAQRSYMQSLTLEEREKIRAEQNQVSNEMFEIIVPVGTPIMSVQNIAGKAIIEELNIADLKEGSMVRFWIEGGSEQLTAVKGEALYVEFVQIAGGGGN